MPSYSVSRRTTGSERIERYFTFTVVPHSDFCKGNFQVARQ